ncbi:GNAT family N-acetyltransferase [Microbacterium sp. EST19A]|uniref:GNAT family N-acetyltransferase n=1 Tax=Microbacterium sp. EST19A TaxID=2862681 RepID=UPI001CC163B1|nr:GNAT family N-acetyltransferase [Microbacterium sp. EST19A]
MHDETLTERLILTPLDDPTPALVKALFRIQSDPATWEHLPAGVDADIDETRRLLEGYAASWRRLGLGWWAVRLRSPIDELPAGATVGLGGVAVRDPEVPAWNLGFRLTPAAWGRGFARELSKAAISAALVAQPDLPVSARALTRNVASWRTLERAGLSLRWEGDAPADDVLTSGMPRRVYSDRPLSPALLRTLIALG